MRLQEKFSLERWEMRFAFSYPHRRDNAHFSRLPFPSFQEYIYLHEKSVVKLGTTLGNVALLLFLLHLREKNLFLLLPLFVARGAVRWCSFFPRN